MKTAIKTWDLQVTYKTPLTRSMKFDYIIASDNIHKRSRIITPGNHGNLTI